jgi:hypothetical protein
MRRYVTQNHAGDFHPRVETRGYHHSLALPDPTACSAGQTGKLVSRWSPDLTSHFLIQSLAWLGRL